MIEDRDPMLQSMFAESERTMEGEIFVAQVMQEADRVQRRARAVKFGVGVLFVICAWLLSEPLQTAVHVLNLGISTPIVRLENGLLFDLLMPMNSVAMLVVLSLAGLGLAYRRIFSARRRF